MARDAGRDGDAIELIVRANVHITDQPIESDRFMFTGTLEQIAEDVAASLAVDITFSPDTRTADDFLARAEDFWRLGQDA